MVAGIIVGIEVVLEVDAAIDMDEGIEFEVVSAGSATPPFSTQEEGWILDCEAPVEDLISAKF